MVLLSFLYFYKPLIEFQASQNVNENGKRSQYASGGRASKLEEVSPSSISILTVNDNPHIKAQDK